MLRTGIHKILGLTLMRRGVPVRLVAEIVEYENVFV